MANQFLPLQVPPSGGQVGPSTDVSALSGSKTLVVDGTGATGAIALEGSQDGVSFAPVLGLDILNNPSTITFEAVVAFLRIRRVSGSGVVAASVGANTTPSNVFAPLSSNGTPSDTSTVGSLKTIIVSGTYKGLISIEGSNDSGLTFDPIVGFDTRSSDVKTFLGTYEQMRVFVLGTLGPGTTIALGAGSGNGGTGSECCGCESVTKMYEMVEHFDTSPNGSPGWARFGLVSLVNQMGGGWKVESTAGVNGVVQSIALRSGRTVAFAGPSGETPDPPMSLKARIYFTPSAEVDGVIAIAGLIDIAHNFILAVVTQTVSGVLQWSFLLIAGGPQQVVPTGIPVATTFEDAQLIELSQRPDGTVDLRFDSVFIGNFPVPPAFLSHLYAPGVSTVRNNPVSSGAITVDLLCISEGYVPLEDPGQSSLVTTGDWIQSDSNRTGGDFSTTETVNWDLILNITMAVQQNSSLIAWATISCENDTVGEIVRFRITVDGVPVPSAVGSETAASADEPFSVAMVMEKFQVAAGVRTIALEWQVSGGTGRILAMTKPTEEMAAMLVAEVGV